MLRLEAFPWDFFKKKIKLLLTSYLALVCSVILAIKISRELSFFKDKNFSIIRYASGLKHLYERQAGNASIRSAFGY